MFTDPNYGGGYPNPWTVDDSTTETEVITEVIETETKNGKKKTITKTTTTTKRSPRRYVAPYTYQPYWYGNAGSYSPQAVSDFRTDSNTGTMKMALNS